MNTLNRSAIAGGLLLLAGIASGPVVAQERSPVDLTGTWRWVHHEDRRARTRRRSGEYWGLPLNDAARMRADTYNESG